MAVGVVVRGGGVAGVVDDPVGTDRPRADRDVLGDQVEPAPRNRERDRLIPHARVEPGPGPDPRGTAPGEIGGADPWHGGLLASGDEDRADGLPAVQRAERRGDVGERVY